jgi:hypothetical protein
MAADNIMQVWRLASVLFSKVEICQRYEATEKNTQLNSEERKYEK